MGGLISVIKRKKPEPLEDPWANPRTIENIDAWAQGMKLRRGCREAVLISDLFSADPRDPEATLQWVNLVMAGGGMLGIAHVGFMRVLEQAGIRFIGLAGASAGAINAALVAAVREKPDKASWEILQQILNEVQFYEFEDGNSYFVRFRKWLVKTGVQFKRMLFSLFRNMSTVSDAFSAMGLHKGHAFKKWLKTQMTNHHVLDTDQLLQKMRLSDNGVRLFRPVVDPSGDVRYMEATPLVEGPDHDRFRYPLRLMASEVATQSMIVFPRDADLFYNTNNEAHPADFVRASMSVPLFFQPFCIPYIDPEDNIQYGAVRHAGAERSQDWRDRVGYGGGIPQRAVFCDGGTLSNFPMHVFADDLPTENGKPLCPIIGVRLSPDRSGMPKVQHAAAYLGCMFDTTRNLLDREFLFKNPAYKNWVGTVNTAGFDWLGFDMTKATRSRLLLAGMQAGKEFLQKHMVAFRDERGAPGPPDDGPPGAPSKGSPAIAADAIQRLLEQGLEPGKGKVAAAKTEWEMFKEVKLLRDTAEGIQDSNNMVMRTKMLQYLDLENLFNRDVAPAMERLQALKAELGDTWAYGIFMPDFDIDRRNQALQDRRVRWAYGILMPVFDIDRRNQALQDRRLTQTFWRKVQAAYQPKGDQLQVITDDWWTSNWLGRGRDYRLLVEPLDIANWYGSHPDEKMSERKHYIDLDLLGKQGSIGPTLEDEMAVDNNRRPGRYLMLQRLEANPPIKEPQVAAKFGVANMKSSLVTARYLKEQVGDKSWNEYVASVGGSHE